MFFLINSLALVLCWIGSAGVYLASDRQHVLKTALPKQLAWTVFVILCVLAFAGLLSVHHWLAAFVIVLSLIMTSWIALALVIPYFPQQARPLFIGSALSIVLAIIGGVYVL